jgi:mono/diheme cytochrome c family protein
VDGTTEGGLRKALVGSALLSIALGSASGCGQESLSPSAARGRQVYLAQCIACHAMDPAKPGPVGPPVKGASRELLEVKVLKGAYPPGYKPKRPTAIMPPQPQIAPDIDALADFLK